MDDNDPIKQFFPDQEEVDLYAVLSLASSATPEEIKKAYRRHALLYHPDKHSSANEEAKAAASLKFQQIGFAYAVLSDEKRRGRYDRTGKTDDGADGLDPGEGGWEAYFADLFDRVTRQKLDEMKAGYQGSQEELDDLKHAYEETKGNIGDIMMQIPHSTYEDEARFITILSDLIKNKELKALPAWKNSIHDEKAKLVRRKQGEKEAAEAEEMAKELGVWDEFYGSGKAGERKGKSKGKSKADDNQDEEDYSALQALILKKKKNTGSFFDDLAAKYTEAPKSSKKSKRKKGQDEDEESSHTTKKSKKVTPPDIDDAEFEELQKKLFGKKEESANDSPKKKGRSRKNNS